MSVFFGTCLIFLPLMLPEELHLLDLSALVEYGLFLVGEEEAGEG